MWPNLQETVDLVTFTDEILNREKNVLYWGTPNLRRIKTQIPLKAIFLKN